MRTEADARRDPQPGDVFSDGSHHYLIGWRDKVIVRHRTNDGEWQYRGLDEFVAWASDARRVDVVRVAQGADHA